MNRALAGITAGLVVLAIAGCSPSEPAAGLRSGAAADVAPVQDSPSNEATGDPVTTPAEDPSPEGVDPCSHVGAGAVADLAGTELEPHPYDVGGVPACIWGNLNTIGVQVILVGAEVWATGLPSVGEQLLEDPLYADQLSDDERETLTEAIAEVEAGDAIEPGRACEIFELMLFQDAQVDGLNYTVRIVPSAEDPQALTAQGCVDGTFASLLLVRPDLTGSTEELDRIGDLTLELLDAE